MNMVKKVLILLLIIGICVNDTQCSSGGPVNLNGVSEALIGASIVCISAGGIGVYLLGSSLRDILCKQLTKATAIKAGSGIGSVIATVIGAYYLGKAIG